MLARIMLRHEFSRDPTISEVNGQIEKLREKSVPLPSLDIITAAFENGEEVCPFHRCIRVPTANSVYDAESVPVETRVQRIRRESPVGDRHRIPTSQGRGGRTKETQYIGGHLIECTYLIVVEYRETSFKCNCFYVPAWWYQK